MDKNSQISTLVIIQAYQLIQKGKPEESSYLLKNELSKKPNSKIILYYLGLTYRALNDFEQAEQFYFKALASKEDVNVPFPNLIGYDYMGAPDDGIYCQLGIVYQLKKEYQKAIDAFEKAIRLNKDYFNAFNSLTITYWKKGDLNKAIEICEAGINRLFHSIYEKLKNVIENKRIGFIGYKTEGKIWLEKALEVLLFFACKENKIEKLSWPTGEQAEEYYSSDQHGGLLFIDYTESKTRFMLPNYLDTFYEALKSNINYSLFLSNKARIFVDLDRTSEAKVLLEESIEFIPEGEDFKDPYITLSSL